MTSLLFQPLTVSNLPLMDSSEFDRRHAEFGYTFPDPNRSLHWVNGEWNWVLAGEVTTKLNNASWKHTTLAGFPLGDVSGITGESFTEAMKRPFMEDPDTTRQLLTKSENVIQDYVNYQLNLAA